MGADLLEQSTHLHVHRNLKLFLISHIYVVLYLSWYWAHIILVLYPLCDIHIFLKTADNISNCPAKLSLLF